MTQWRFYWTLFKRSWVGSWGRAHKVEVTIAIFIIGVFVLWPSLEQRWRIVLAAPLVWFVVDVLLSPYRQAFLMRQEELAERRDGDRLLDGLLIEDIVYERVDREGIKYTSKVRIQLHNGTGTVIKLGSPMWQRKPTDVPIQAQHEMKWQVMRGGWQSEEATAKIGPGESCRTWIGLDPSVPEPQLKYRHNILRLGTLVFDVMIGDRPVSHEIRL